MAAAKNKTKDISGRKVKEVKWKDYLECPRDAIDLANKGNYVKVIGRGGKVELAIGSPIDISKIK